ncbi:MAG: hypothetical protein FWD73_01375 [Polyangiaceae bacterium]|nr:hypothetical protein [Polyangiaceae bacterium]
MNFRQTTFASLATTLLIAGGTIAFVACSSSSNNDNSSGNTGNNTQTGGGGQGTANSNGMVSIEGLTEFRMVDDVTLKSSTLAQFYVDPQASNITGNLPLGCKTSHTPATIYTGPEVSAGDITINVGDKSATLTWDDSSGWYANPSYTFDIGSNNWITSGDDVSVVAKGATFPAFSASLKAPHMPIFTSDLTAMQQNSDYTLTWDNGAASEQIVVVMSNADFSNMDSVVSVTCVFDSSAGAGTIPAAQLADLGSGAISFEASSTTATQVSAGNNKVDVIVKTMYDASAKIQ